MKNIQTWNKRHEIAKSEEVIFAVLSKLEKFVMVGRSMKLIQKFSQP